MDNAHWDLLVAPLLQRKMIITVDALAGATRMVAENHEKGFPRPFIISGLEGTGDLPDPEHAEWVILGTSGGSMMEGIRAFHTALRHLPPDVVAKVDAWDPDHEAVALGNILDTNVPVAGRPAWGGSPPEWKALEDKMIVDGLWDEAGVARAPSTVVPVDEASATARGKDEGLGTVWVGDNREGWHGGAEMLRWVRTEQDAEKAGEFFGQRCDRVRVMPFLEGIPCSIHAMVYPGAVIAFRPVEMVIMRPIGGSQLRYCGPATAWDPHPADREYMRDVAKAVGAHLRERVGYRGAFTVDGVMTRDGFRPTELNPRLSGGLGIQVFHSRIPVGALHRALVAGEELEYRPEDLERAVIAGADEHRFVGGFSPVAAAPLETAVQPIAVVDQLVTPVESADAGHGDVTHGPGPNGGVIRLRVNPEHVRPGPSIAPTVRSALALADDLWDVGIGPLEVAERVR